MVSFARFGAPTTRSATTTSRGLRAYQREERNALTALFLTAYQQGVARVNYHRNLSNRRAGEMYAAANPPSSPLPPILPSPIPEVTLENAIREYEQLGGRRSRVRLQDEPAAVLHSIMSARAPVAWGDRNRRISRHIQLSRVAPGAPRPDTRTLHHEVSPVKRPQFTGAQRSLSSTFAEMSIPSPSTPPRSPESPTYSPTAPSTGPPTPYGPSWDPTPPASASDEVATMWPNALDVNDFLAQLVAMRMRMDQDAFDASIDAVAAAATAADVIALPNQLLSLPGVDITDGSELFPIDLTDESEEGSKECPIQLA